MRWGRNLTKPNQSLLEVEQFAIRQASRLTQLNQELARCEGAREAVAQTLAAAEERATTTGDEAELLSTVLDRLQGMEEVWQRKFQRSMETIVSEGLSLVFGGELELMIVSSTKASMSAVEFVLKKDGEEEDIVEGQGGGYVGLIAFLLRVLLIMASRPLLRLVLIMDEPFAQVSPDFRPGLAEMISALIDRLEFQLIMVTHEPEYVDTADVAYRFRMVRDATQVEVLKSPDADKNQTDA